uniref:Major facilitator superfamily (MFS) profile domain-containing protein n=1 Tax=Biomphalaria glabrata TaxID=6526 RepID=A0A2C9KI01_BIOGL
MPLQLLQSAKLPFFRSFAITPFCQSSWTLEVRQQRLKSSGATAPVVGEALAWWSPDSEKLTWIAFSYAGFNVGAIVCSVVSGYLCTVSLDNGWPFIFYFTGTVNLIWLMAWYFLYMDKPEKHPYISETERAYILANRTGMTSSEK